MALTPAVVAQRQEAALSLYMRVSEAVQAQPHQGRWDRPSHTRWRTTAVETPTAHLEVAIDVRLAQRPSWVALRGGPT